MPHVGENPDPPQAEGVEAALVTTTGSTRMAIPWEGPSPMGQDALLRCGALSNDRNMLTQLEDAIYTEISSELMKELDSTTKKVDGILEEECHDLFSVVAASSVTPCFLFEEVMGPVPEESRGDLAAAMEGHMNTLLGKFFCSDGEEPDKDYNEEHHVVVPK
ncbi:hypothetical protein D1007_40134 [Hordeum vulgare]|nr:hypothetical protein D1007_40134 [Hordeum vulgare]